MKRGFTIIELLVVISVIGILASITLVAYNGVNDRAKVTSLKSDLVNSYEVLNSDYALSNSSTYPASAGAANGGQGLKASTGNSLNYTVNNSANPATFCLVATNGSLNYYVSSTSSVPISGTTCP